LITCTQDTFPQAEQPTVYYDYFKINENAAKIKSAKIKKITTLLINKDAQDTVNIAYYDQNGFVIENNSLYKIISNGEIKNIYLKNTYLYDEFGKLIDKTDTSNTSFRKISLNYEDNGNLAAETVFDSKGNKTKKITYEYDDLARLIESDERDLLGDCKITKKYAYDSYNHMAKYSMTNTCKDADLKSMDITYVYKYDKKSNILEKNTLYPAGGYRTEQFTYGTNGLLSQNYVITGTDIYTNYIYSYDKSNLLIRIDRTEVNGLVRKKFYQIYKYDNFGNVLDKQEFTEDNSLIYLNKFIYEFY
jgi:hypothetical protein